MEQVSIFLIIGQRWGIWVIFVNFQVTILQRKDRTIKNGIFIRIKGYS